MTPAKKDPLDAIRRHAGKKAGVDAGTACTQDSFKVGGKAFLYVGMQGGRCKLMLKLGDSLDDARTLAKAQPDRFEVGKTGFVTVRFPTDDPLPAKHWRAWIDESYAVASGGGARKATRKTPTSAKAAAKKKAAPAAKKAARKKAAAKKTSARRKA